MNRLLPVLRILALGALCTAVECGDEIGQRVQDHSCRTRVSGHRQPAAQAAHFLWGLGYSRQVRESGVDTIDQSERVVDAPDRSPGCSQLAQPASIW